MQIAVIGTGYVGLVSGACLAHVGWNVTCLDRDSYKISKLREGIMPIYEPGLEQIVNDSVAAGTLTFSDSPFDAIKGADIILIAVGTPTDPVTGKTDLSYIEGAVRDCAPFLKAHAILVTKSTVPVGTGDFIKQTLTSLHPDIPFSIASNPEFLREGCAVSDCLKPDRIVIGSDDNHAKDRLAKLYEPFTRQGYPLVITHLRSPK